MISRPSKKLVLAAAVLSALAAALPAQALTITPTFEASITSDPNAAAIEGIINTAINTYQTDFTDPINVTIDFNSVNTGLGQSSTTLYKLNYATVQAAMVADANTTDDAAALLHLPASATNPVTGSTTINLKTANIRALGIPGSFPPIGGFDGTISLNTHITTPGSPGSSLQYNLLAVTEHEIDEVLGLGSDLGSTNSFFSDPAMEDLFRYDNAGNRSFTTNSSALAYFSIDTTTLLAQFDNQNDGGDWGDWQSNPLPPSTPPKVQDAFAIPGATPALGVELRALDVIGYTPAITPEPASLSLCAIGAAALLTRRRQRH